MSRTRTVPALVLAALALGLGLGLAGPPGADAQTMSGTSFRVDGFVVGNGGSPVGPTGIERTGASFASLDTLGQPAIGPVNGASFAAGQGWIYQFLSAPPSPPVSIVTATLPNGTEGAPYLATIAVSGGLAPFSGTLVGGTLPPGLTIDPLTGDVTGVPAANGVFTFTIQVSDSQSPPSSAVATYTVTIHPPLTILTLTLPDAALTTNYNATITVTGGEAPYGFGVTAGTLPVGMILDPSTGTISGLPTLLGTSAFTMAVTDATPGGMATTSQPLSIRVYAVAAPANLSAIAKNGQADVSWDIVPGAASYKLLYGSTTSGVYDGTESIAGPSPIAGITINSVTLTGLSNTKTYFIAIVAVDALGNEGPPSAEITAKPLPSGQEVQTRVVAGGTSAEDYRMIGWPVLPSNQDPIANLSDDLGPYDPTTWRMFHWIPPLRAYEETGSTGNTRVQKIAPGEGFWMLVSTSSSINVQGSLADAAKPYDVMLEPGWNMVANPWDFAVDVADFRVDGIPLLDPANADPLTAKTRQDVWDFPGTYVSVDQMVNGKAYWIKNLTAKDVTLTIPPIPSQAAPAAKASYRGARGRPVSAMQTYRRASGGDDLPPPPPGTGVTPAFAMVAPLKHGGGGGGTCFAGDFRHREGDGRTWLLIAGMLGLAAWGFKSNSKTGRNWPWRGI